MSGNLEETIQVAFPATDYDDVNAFFLHHLPPPPLDHHHHYNNNIERTSAVAGGSVGTDALSSWGDDEKAAGTLESIVHQATCLVSKGDTSTIYHGGGNNMIMNDDISKWFSYNRAQASTSTSVDNITTTLVVNDSLVPASKNQHHHLFVQMLDSSEVVRTKDTHGPEIEHRNGKEQEEETYAANEAAHHDVEKYMVMPSKCKDGPSLKVDDHRDDPSVPSLLTYTTNACTRSVESHHHHPQREGRQKTKKLSNTTSNTTILHNKAERKRRDKITQRMEALRDMVPNICYKTDKATMLDQVIEYIKKLQNQTDQMMIMMRSYGMINNNMPSYPMMIPMPYYMFMQQQQQQQQQQLQMSLMADAQMDVSVGLGSMHTNPIMHPNMSITGTSRTPAIVHPTSTTPLLLSKN